jgi:mRNA interferase MazF
VKYNKGDIVLVPFPFTDGKNVKPRPAIVISNSKVNITQDIILAQITSKSRSDIFSYVINNSELTDPLHLESEVRCHKIFTMQQNVILKKISALKGKSLESLTQQIIGVL